MLGDVWGNSWADAWGSSWQQAAVPSASTSFEADLNAHLIASSAIVAAVASFNGLACVWPNVRPEGSGLPAVTTQVIFTQGANDLDGEDGDLLNKRVQIDCWAESYDAARTLAETVRARMKTEAASFASLMLSDQDLFEPDTKLSRVSMDFSCWYDVP